MCSDLQVTKHPQSKDQTSYNGRVSYCSFYLQQLPCYIIIWHIFNLKCNEFLFTQRLLLAQLQKYSLAGFLSYVIVTISVLVSVTHLVYHFNRFKLSYCFINNSILIKFEQQNMIQLYYCSLFEVSSCSPRMRDIYYTSYTYNKQLLKTTVICYFVLDNIAAS